jgi:uncharacterized protein (DUF1330 family)
MPKGYWIVRVDIADEQKYRAYIAANAEPLKKYGARFLVRAGRYENPEGASRSRNAVIEFPTYQAALDCWKSPEYQEAIKLRQSVSTADLIIIEGYEGPQPA